VPSFLEAPVAGAYHVLTSLVTALEPLAGTYAAVIAIVLCTLAVRLCLVPLSVRAYRGLQARAELMPQLKQLTERHRDNPERLQREVAKLQSESGTSLFAGFLPTLAQLPFFWLMYTLFSRGIVAGESNQLISGSLLGAPLGLHWPILTGTPAYVVLAVLLAVVAWFSARLQLRRMDDSATPLSRRLAQLLPFGTLATAAFVPLASGLYLLTTTTWTLVERTILQR
jgi:YidC/Oxa1 family membrane protein insertase